MAGDDDDQAQARHRADVQLRAVLNNAPIVIFHVDARGVFTLSEGKGLEVVGLAPGQLVGASALEMYREIPIVQADGSVVLGQDAVRRVLAGETITGLTRLGDEFYDNRFVPDLDRDGQVHGMIGVAVVITQRHRAELRVAQLNRIHAMLSGINHTIVREREPARLLEAACRLAVDTGRFRMAWIAMLDPYRRAATVAASAGVVDGYLDGSVLTVDRDPTVRVAVHGTREIHNDLAAIADPEPWVVAARARGYRACAAFPLNVRGSMVGAFGVYAGEPGVFDAEETVLLDELAVDIAFALEVHERDVERRHVEQALRESEGHLRERSQRLQHSEASLAESERLLRALAARVETVREQERAELAREIHDVLGQELTGLKMDIAWVMRRLIQDHAPPAEAIGRLQTTLQQVDGTVATVRRIATSLRPGVLDDLGLGAALEWQAKEFQTRSGIAVELALPPEELVLDNARATAVFRIFQELLTNVARHAHASRVRARLAHEPKSLVLEVADDGRGLAAGDLVRPSSLGLLGIRERALAFGGTLTIDSLPATGTTAVVRIPLVEPA